MSQAVELRTVDQLPLASTPTENPVMGMIRQAVAAGQPLDVIRELKDMAKELAADEARRAFDEAVAAAKAEIKPIVRAREGHNSKYADLGDVAEVIDPIISKFGLSYRHKATQTPQISVTCVLSHKAGYSEETTLSAGADKTGNKNDIQALGSTLTYLQRYTVMLALGLSTTRDDDGQTSSSVDTITEQQALDLNDLIDTVVEEVKGNRPVFVKSFLKFMKADRIEAIAAKDHQKAVSAINASRTAR